MRSDLVFGALLAVPESARSDQAGARDWVPVLAEVPLFDGISQRHLRKLAAIASRRRLLAHSRIVREGEPGNAFYVILEGEAQVDTIPPVTLTAGQYFGELALLDGGPRTATVTAVSEILLLEIGRAPFARLVRDEPTLAAALLRELARRLRDVTP